MLTKAWGKEVKVELTVDAIFDNGHPGLEGVRFPTALGEPAALDGVGLANTIGTPDEARVGKLVEPVVNEELVEGIKENVPGLFAGLLVLSPSGGDIGILG